MNTIELAIEDSKYMLNMQDNYDDEGEISVSLNTWEITVGKLREIYAIVKNGYGMDLIAPKIYHGNNGSIDIFWETRKYKLLANFPTHDETIIPDEEPRVSFFGQTQEDENIKGSFPISGGNNLIWVLIGLSQ